MVMPEQAGMGDEPWLMIRCVYVGLDEDEGNTVLDRLRRAAPPDEQTAGPVSWPEWQSSKDDLRSEEHTSELQSRGHLVCRLLLEKKKIAALKMLYKSINHKKQCLLINQERD